MEYYREARPGSPELVSGPPQPTNNASSTADEGPRFIATASSDPTFVNPALSSNYSALASSQNPTVPQTYFQLVSLVWELQNGQMIMKPLLIESEVIRLCKSLGSADHRNQSLSDRLFQPTEADMELGVTGLFGPPSAVVEKLSQLRAPLPPLFPVAPVSPTDDGQGIYAICQPGSTTPSLLIFPWLSDKTFGVGNVRGVPTLVLRWITELAPKVVFCLSDGSDDLKVIENAVAHAISNAQLPFSVSLSIRKDLETGELFTCVPSGEVSLPAMDHTVVPGAIALVMTECLESKSSRFKSSSKYFYSPKSFYTWLVQTSKDFTIEIESCPPSLRQHLLEECGLWNAISTSANSWRNEHQEFMNYTIASEFEHFKSKIVLLASRLESVGSLIFNGIFEPSSREDLLSHANQFYHELVKLSSLQRTQDSALLLSKVALVLELDEIIRMIAIEGNWGSFWIDGIADRIIMFFCTSTRSDWEHFVAQQPKKYFRTSILERVQGFLGYSRDHSGERCVVYSESFKYHCVSYLQRTQGSWSNLVHTLANQGQSRAKCDMQTRAMDDFEYQMEEWTQHFTQTIIKEELLSNYSGSIGGAAPSLRITLEKPYGTRFTASCKEEIVTTNWIRFKFYHAADRSSFGSFAYPAEQEVVRLFTLAPHLIAVLSVEKLIGKFTIRVLALSSDKAKPILERYYPNLPVMIDYDPQDRCLSWISESGTAFVSKFNNTFTNLDQTHQNNLETALSSPMPWKDISLFGGNHRGFSVVDCHGGMEFFNIRSRQLSHKLSIFSQEESKNIDLFVKKSSFVKIPASHIILIVTPVASKEDVAMESSSDSDAMGSYSDSESMESCNRLRSTHSQNGLNVDHNFTFVAFNITPVTVVEPRRLKTIYISLACVSPESIQWVYSDENLYALDNQNHLLKSFQISIHTGDENWQLFADSENAEQCAEKDSFENSHWLCALFHMGEKFPLQRLMSSVGPEPSFVIPIPSAASNEFQHVLQSFLSGVMDRLTILQKPLYGFDLLTMTKILNHEDWEAICAEVLEVAPSLHLSPWLQALISIIPLQVCRAEYSKLTIMADGKDETIDIGENAEAFEVAESIRFGLMATLLENWRGPVRVVTSMGKQSTGKSYLLNHLTGSSFSISGSRCTDGVWITMQISRGTMLVILDFEGLGSFERTLQEDVFLSVLNSSISSLTIFRIEMRFDKDISAMFRKFQEGIQLIKGDDRLFKGALLLNVKDVNSNDQRGVMEEFKGKVQSLLADNKSVNFLTEMYGGRLQILCCPPLGTPGYFKALAQTHQHLQDVLVSETCGFANGYAFLDCFRLILAKIAILDWTAMDASFLRMKISQIKLTIVSAVRYGAEASQGSQEGGESMALTDAKHQPITVTSAEVLSYCPSHAARWTAFCGTAELEEDAGMDLDIRDHHENLPSLFTKFIRISGFNDNSTKDRANCGKVFPDYLSYLAQRRALRVTKWLRSHLPDSNCLDFEDRLKAVTVMTTICGSKCIFCNLPCLQAASHPSEYTHSCGTDHTCSHECSFTHDPSTNVLSKCGKTAGHEGSCNCQRIAHSCGQTCHLSQSPNCGGACCQLVGHDGDHTCDSTFHSCGASCNSPNCLATCVIDIKKPHTIHKCIEVRCTANCAIPGCLENCACDDHFHGRPELTVQFRLENAIVGPSVVGGSVHICSKSHPCREPCSADGICEVKVHMTQRTETFTGKRAQTFQYARQEMNGKRNGCHLLLDHSGPHLCSDDATYVHYCQERCPSCDYYCNKPFAHPGEHATSHGNMKHTYFVTGSGTQDIDVHERKYAAGDRGIAEMCPLFCSKMGRGHIHFMPCEHDDSEGCVYGDGSGVGDRRRHCALKLEPHPDRPMDELLHDYFWNSLGWADPCLSAADRNLFNKCPFQCDAPEHSIEGEESSDCLLDVWHPPCIEKGNLGNGHKFGCTHASNTGRLHHIFVLDSSGSMQGSAWQDLIRALEEFVSDRLQTASSDLVSIVTFDSAAEISVEATALVRGVSNHCVYRGGGTSFDSGLRCASAILSRNDHTQYTPVLFFFSDGESSDGVGVAQHIAQNFAIFALQTFVIGFGSQNSYLGTIATALGGSFLDAVASINLGQTFRAISASLATHSGLVIDSPRPQVNMASPSHSGIICPICQQGMTIALALSLPCGHYFHHPCITEYRRGIQSSSSSSPSLCPVCRAAF